MVTFCSTRIFVISLLCTLSIGVEAREVDNYLAWGVDLSDSGPTIDAYMRDKMLEAIEIEKVSERELPPPGEAETHADVVAWYSSCYGTVGRLMRASFYSPTYQKIEEFIEDGSGLDIYPRRPSTKDDEERIRLRETPEDGYMTNREYIRGSIVGSSPFNVPMSRFANVYGIHTGADKFGHFTSFGRRYLKQFVKLVEKGASKKDAFYEVMDGGYSSEEGAVGMMFTNVFSRGDLEANYQGMLFAVSLCLAESTVKLTFNGEAWELENIDLFTIQDYINPNWDESFHNSIFSDNTWEKDVTPMFAARNECANLSSSWVTTQREFYRGFPESSRSIEYGESWIPENFEGRDAKEHSLDSYCETEKVVATAPLSPAESGNPLPAREDEWRYSIAFPMIWAPDINGKIRGDEQFDFEIPFRDILDNLNVGIMFELYANRGPYGLALRSNFMRVATENSRSGLLDTRIETELDMGVTDFVASFRVHDKLRLVAGVRHVLAKMELDIYSTLGNIEILDERIVLADDDKFDLLFGINFNHWFNDKWGLMLNSDLGVVGDNDRDFSVDFRGLYRVSDLNNFWFGFRYLQIGSDVIEDDITYKVDMTQIGPTIGWAFTF